ncbi:MAG: YecH family metal-binding protein [Endozoicomonas sp.]
MKESIHGHNVLKLIREQDQAGGRDDILGAINLHFGPEARFHTCSANDLPASELVELFLNKGKLVEEESAIRFVGCQCQHH